MRQPPIFVGGTGRSGTTILGRLLGRHRDYALIPVEAKFHCSPEGLPGLLLGRQTPERFAERMLGEWFHPPGQSERLAAFLTRDALAEALARFLAVAAENPVAAGRSLVEELFGSYARAQGKGGWVEMTPINAMWGAPHLARLFPELRFVNIIRDGRDVAASLIHMGWLTDPHEALLWWEQRMLRAHRELASLPADALLTLPLERLLVDDREGAFQELDRFMGWEEDDSMWGFFTRRMPPEEAHVGRWKTDFCGRERELIESEYEAILERLRAAAVPLPAGASYCHATQ